LSPKGNTYTDQATQAFYLCERGVGREALEMVGRIKSAPERMLIEGCAIAFTKPERAKDLLSKALRSLPGGEISEKAHVWLACCYWATGEAGEASAILDSINPSTDSVRFLVGLNSSIFETGKPKRSLRFLSGVEALIDSVPAIWKGKFFNQRGWLMRRLKNLDAAIRDYETARFWFEQTAAPEYMVATASNNLAGVMIDAKRYAEAHVAVDRAIDTLPLGDTFFRAQFLDQKSLIFLAEGHFKAAVETAQSSVAFLNGGDNHALLAESLITLARALKGSEEYAKALAVLDRARSLAEYLDSKAVLLKIKREQKEAALALSQRSHVELVEIALSLSDYKLRGAARLIGVKVQPLSRFIKLHDIEIKQHLKVPRENS
jgi:tetratricopeptide (TPR) repeat protein